jgi:DNA-binding GntR family transcriptional regulator
MTLSARQAWAKDDSARRVTYVDDSTGSLADQAYARIKESIVNCALAPGQKITERQLAKQLGYGLSPIRTALVRLDHDGLITTRARSGYRVVPLTVEDVDSVFDVWSVIGSAIIERAAQRCTARDRAEIGDTVRRLRAEQREGHPDALDTAGVARAVWRLYCRIAGNPRLTEIYERLDDDLQRMFVIGAWDAPDGAERYFATFEDDPPRLGEPSASAELFRGYVQHVHERLLERLRASASLRAHEIVLGEASDG